MDGDGFVTVALRSELPQGGMRRVEVAGRPVVLYDVDGAVYATDDTCTHARASLAEGAIAGRIVKCPLHGARFDVTTGRVMSPPAFKPLRTYQARVEGGEIQLRV